MKKSIFVMICVLGFIFGSIFLPTTEAEIFKIGTRQQQNVIDLYTFTSGAVVFCSPAFKDDVHLIFDGNESTGLDLNNSDEYITIILAFPYPINVSNITVKPKFGGGKCNYSLGVRLQHIGSSGAEFSDSEKTYSINNILVSIFITIVKSANDHYYFNDVLINYTQVSSNLEGIKNQIKKINKELDLIENDIIELKKDIIGINENITNIKKDMPSEYNDSALQEKINNLTQEINSLKENLSKINKSIPMEYNDSEIKSNILHLESSDVYLKLQIGNLTLKVENLTNELEKLSSEIQDLHGVGSDKTKDSTEENRIQEYTYSIIFGVIIIILLLVILKLSLTILKQKHHNIEEPRTDDILISKIKYDILTNKEIKDSRLYDEEYKRLLENGYQKGEMSQETYNYIKTVLEVSEEP